MAATVIYDIDGTVLDSSKGLKEYYDANSNVVSTIHNYRSLGYKIIMLTARPLKSTLATHRNLKSLGIPYDKLIMNNFNEPESFKAVVRDHLERHGHTIIASYGDKYTDLHHTGRRYLTRNDVITEVDSV